MPNRGAQSKPDEQLKGFRQAARELGCDESEIAFDSKLEKVARAAVPRKAAARTKGGASQKGKKAEKAAAAPVPAKKKIRFILPGA